MSIRLTLMSAVLLTALAVGTGPAQGQREIGAGLRNHDTNAPVDVGADRAEVDDRANRATISGNVDVRQAKLRLRADRVTLSYAGGANKIQRIDASGGVTVTSPTETIRGNTAIYDLQAQDHHVLGNVSLENPMAGVNGGPPGVRTAFRVAR
jgi:lipopolysaccharide export system protein LptA